MVRIKLFNIKAIFCHVLLHVQKQKMNLNVALNVAFMMSHNENRSGGVMVYWVDNQIMLQTEGLEHYANFKVLGSGYIPHIKWHFLIYFYVHTVEPFLNWIFVHYLEIGCHGYSCPAMYWRAPVVAAVTEHWPHWSGAGRAHGLLAPPGGLQNHWDCSGSTSDADLVMSVMDKGIVLCNQCIKGSLFVTYLIYQKFKCHFLLQGTTLHNVNEN